MTIEDLIRQIVREEIGRSAVDPEDLPPEDLTTERLRDTITASVGRIGKPAVVEIMKDQGSLKVSEYDTQDKMAALVEALNNA